jgi:beta-glucosidase
MNFCIAPPGFHFPKVHRGMTFRRSLVLVLSTCIAIGGQAQVRKLPPYKNAKLPVEKRVEDLLSRMTLEEKFWQLFMTPGDIAGRKEKYRHGIFGLQMATRATSNKVSEQLMQYGSSGTAQAAAEKINAVQRYFVEETRLGIPIVPFDEALHGLVREGATSFPQSIALAATWDPQLMSQVSHAIALETRTRGIRQILSPVVNMATDVRWGRVEETYGEDPFLSAVMGVAFVKEFEKLGVITTPKHFVANHGDGGRDSYPVHWTERYLEEEYFPPFKACFHAGGSRSVMTSYNSLDGRPNTANAWLLKKKLKGEWGFQGFAICDAGSVGGMTDLHRTSPDYADAMKQAIENGLDVVLQTSVDHFPLFFRKALENRTIDPRAVDEAVKRVLRAKFELGLFEHPYVDPADAEKWNGHPEHRALARQAAREAIVLLKNSHNILPLKKALTSIAVIGPDAAEMRLGGYSGPGNQKVSILEGIKGKLGTLAEVRYAEGCKRTELEAATIPAEYLRCTNGGTPARGLLATYWDNPDLFGKSVVQRVDPELQFRWALFSPHEGISRNWFSARWSGELVASKTGKISIGLEGNDGYRLFVNDSLIIDNWEKVSYRTILRPIDVVQGAAYEIRIEYRETTGFGRLRLVWDQGIKNDWRAGIEQAVRIAEESDLAVIAVGLIEGESLDRASLALPGHQPELIQAVAATGKPVVVVIVGGSAVTMDGWLDQVDGIVDVWYPGEEGGNAVADVLFGDYNPAGRLPVTFPLAVGQVPLIYNHEPTGRIDYYYDLPGQPLFPFGYGLSYTTFSYSDMTFDKQSIGKGDSLRVHVTVKNTGKRDGDEVVQLYLQELLATVVRPIQELKAFQRVPLKAGESRELTFVITPEMLTILNERMKRVIEPGEFRVMAGSSAADIRLQRMFTVE